MRGNALFGAGKAQSLLGGRLDRNLLDRAADGGGKVLAFGARGFGKEHRDRAVADARAERLIGKLADALEKDGSAGGSRTLSRL